MANYVLTNPMIFLNEHDLTGNLTGGTINYASELVEDTCFGDTTRSRLGGLKTVILDINGFIDMAEPDKEIFDNLAYESARLTICPTTGVDGEPAYFYRPLLTSYTMKAVLGEKYSFNLHAETADSTTVPRIIRGTLLLGKATKTSSSSGTAYELGAVTAAQAVYGVMHCFSASAGDTLDVIVQSDSASNFPSPTTRLTFTQVSGGTAAADWQYAAGAIADTWWRISWTIAGVDPSFSFAVAIGID